MYLISKEYEFSAAHRIEGHPKCGRLHGHNYRVIVKLGGTDVDSMGMVLDYHGLDRIVKPIVEELDHRYLVSQTNLSSLDPYQAAASTAGRMDDLFLLDINQTTAEELARWLYREVKQGLHSGGYYAIAENLEVTVCETLKVTATFSLY